MTTLGNPEKIIERLRKFQRTVRDVIIQSRSGLGLNEVSRSTSADTIYQIDTAVDPLLHSFCEEWGKETPLVLVAEGLENENGEEGPMTFPRGTREEDALLRVIVDPIDGTRGIMYDKRAAWALAGVAPNKGSATRLRDIEVAVMTELPTSKMAFGDVLWAIKGKGAKGVRERFDGETKARLEPAVVLDDVTNRPLGRVLTKMGKVADQHVVEALNAQKREGGMFGQILKAMGHVSEQDIQIALAFQKGQEPEMAAEVMHVITGEPIVLRPSEATDLNHGFASVCNFFPGTKVLASEMMEFVAKHLQGEADVTRAAVFDDQYISTGGQFYEMIMGHDRFIADVRPAFYRLLNKPEGLSCHPYDCAAMLVAEEAGVIITDEAGQPLDGPFDTTTGLSWIGYANASLRKQIEPLVMQFLQSKRSSV